MKRKFCVSLFLSIFVFCSFFNVKASNLSDIISENSSNDSDLIKVSSTIDSSLSFKFDNLIFDNLSIYSSGDSLILYTKITNNTSKSLPISFNILLFNSEKKNIGYFNYCSSIDTETDYSYKKIASNETIDFNLNVTKRYLANSDKYKVSDISYYYVVDDNKYCKIGGYDKYEGLTLSDIASNKTASSNSSSSFSIPSNGFSFSFIKYNGLNLISILCVIIALAVCLAIYIAYGVFLNKLHEEMFNKKNVLCFVPIANNFICFKLAFGEIIGFVYLGLFVFGLILSLLQISFVSAIVSLACIAAFVVDIIKLVTKNYDMCIVFLQNDVVVNDTSVVSNVSPNEYGFTKDDNIKESMLGVSNSDTLDFDKTNTNSFDYSGLNNNSNDNSFVDLSYNNQNNNSDNLNIGNFNNNQNNNSDNLNIGNFNNNQNNNDDNDLSKFFR